MGTKNWFEVAKHLAQFTYSDGEKISWREISRMLGVPKSTLSDALRKEFKQCL